jgi:hypothetical protein
MLQTRITRETTRNVRYDRSYTERIKYEKPRQDVGVFLWSQYSQSSFDEVLKTQMKFATDRVKVQ